MIDAIDLQTEEELDFPKWWRLAVIALSTLILCACNGRSELPSFATPVAAQDTLPLEAFTGHPGDGATVPGVVAPSQADPPIGGKGVAPEHVPPIPIVPWTPPGLRQPWPRDEYICDGGDKTPGVRVAADWEVLGLNLEDTIGHFDTLDGRTIVKPSNRVCIYSPRFAVVRKIDAPVLNQQNIPPAGVRQPLGPIVQNEAQLATTVMLPVQPEGELGTKRPTIFRDHAKGHGLINELMPVAVQDRFQPYENFSAIRRGIVVQDEKARLLESVQAAIVWTEVQAVQVIIDTKSAIALTGDQRAQATYGLKIPDKPCLKICKVASTAAAKPGETVEFTLRFDNIGDQTMGNVTIVDNLTTRLEYVPNSATSTLKGNFSTQNNAGDSLVLRWEIEEPIKPGAGGIIRFRCRVR